MKVVCLRDRYANQERAISHSLVLHAKIEPEACSEGQAYEQPLTWHCSQLGYSNFPLTFKRCQICRLGEMEWEAATSTRQSKLNNESGQVRFFSHNRLMYL